MKANPFIHLIQTPYAKYFFDVNTNRIYNVKESIFESLKKLLENKEELIDENSKAEIEQMQDKGLLKNNKPKTIKHPLTDYMEYYLNHKMENLTLQLTQNCNFRCSYCVYGQETSLNRSHSNKKMTYDTAKEAVDFLLSHSSDADAVNIGFYGGEPLLEFDLLKKILIYAKKTFCMKSLRFGITTNCTLMNDEILDFLYQHTVEILISLDGPKEVHDSKRVFAVNGCGTFDVVMKKLEFIKNKYPDYYENHIGINTVLDPAKEFDCINQMYISNKLLKEIKNPVASLIDDSYSIEKSKYSDQFLQQKRYEDFKIIMNEIGKIKSEKLSGIIKQQQARTEKIKQTLGRVAISEEMSHGGPCIVGRKTFVNIDGNLFPCERVSESSEAMHIGNIRDGFDLDKVNKIMNVAQITQDHCKECWAISRCLMCAKQADNGSTLCAEKKLQQCNDMKYNIELDLRTYIAIKEIKQGAVVS